nr:putative reverse transcriptase domain-containing protein [Tanacetum cinerariifolium]
AKNFQWGLRRSTLNHLMCMSYTDVAQVATAARNYEILHERDDEDTERLDKRRMVIGISRPLSRVVTGATVKITTVMDLTGVVVVITTAAATTTTLAVTTGISVMDVTKETGVISLTDLPILVLSSLGVPLRATLTQYALLMDVDTKESVVELQIILALQARTLLYHGFEGFLATIHDMTSEVPSVHNQPIVSEFPDVFLDELPGIPPVREVEFNIELIPGA